MSIDIRLPNINGKTESEQLAQIRSYLYQFAGQLQWALDTVENKSNSSNVVAQNNSGASSTKEEDPVSNFNELKALIIKSADIVEAYSEQIDNLLNLSGTYVAQSDFGTYTKETNAKVSAGSARIDTLFTNLQEITDTLDGVGETLIGVTANIRTGLLYYDDESGIPVYGIEVGQKNTVNGKETFDKYAQFTADRLSFFDGNGIEVAYISDYKLVITEAYIKGNLQLGGFEFDTSNGLALRWVGRDS